MGLFGNSKERQQKKAAQLYETGLDYYEGRNKPKSMVHAMSNFRLAAEKENVDACRALGWIYLYEEDFNHNVTEAVRWYEKGAAQGDIQCICNLAAVLCNEEEVKDYPRAFELFSQAAEMGNEEGCIYRARFLQQGIGTEKNEAEAKIWYEKAYEAGNREAAEELAVLWEADTISLDAESETDCRQGAGLLEQAAEWHERAAETAEDEAVAAERKQRARDCRAAAADYRRRADAIGEEIRTAWLSAPEPKHAYCIVLYGDYEPTGRQVMSALKRYVGEQFGYTEGAREEYSFFWFEDGGQIVEVTCYEKASRMFELLQQGELPVSRMIPLLSEEDGLTEQMRLCMENCWAQGCFSVLPLLIASAEENEISRFVEQDTRSFARGTGGSGDYPLYRVTGEVSREAVWCPAVLNPMETWWQEGMAVPTEAMEEPGHLPEQEPVKNVEVEEAPETELGAAAEEGLETEPKADPEQDPGHIAEADQGAEEFPASEDNETERILLQKEESEARESLAEHVEALLQEEKKTED